MLTLVRRLPSDEMRLVLKQLGGLVSRPDKSEETVGRVRELAEKLASLVCSKAPPGETPNPVKLLQMHLKHSLFNSSAIKGSSLTDTNDN